MKSNICYVLLVLFCYHANKYNYSLADYIQKDGQLRFVHKYMNSNILHEEILTLEPWPLNKVCQIKKVIVCSMLSRYVKRRLTVVRNRKE